MDDLPSYLVRPCCFAFFVSGVAALLLLAGCGAGGSSSDQPAAASPGAGGGSSPHRPRHHHHHHQKEQSGSNGDGNDGRSKSGTAGGGAGPEPAPSEDKQEREVDRSIREAEGNGIGNDMPGLDYSMVQQGWSHGEAEAFTKLMSAAGLSEKSAESVAAAVLVSGEQGASHREAVAAGLEIYGALGGLGE